MTRPKLLSPPYPFFLQASTLLPISEVEIEFFRMETHNSQEGLHAFWKHESRNRGSRCWYLQGPAIWVPSWSVGETSTNSHSPIYCGARMSPRVPEKHSTHPIRGSRNTVQVDWEMRGRGGQVERWEIIPNLHMESLGPLHKLRSWQSNYSPAN
jgi:hypothetical protein